MNTKQLIVLWYGGFALIVILVAFYSTSESIFPILVIISIIITILLSFLTFRETKNVKRKQVIKQGIVPIIGLICVFGLLVVLDDLTYSGSGYSRSIEIDQIEIIEPDFQIETNAFGIKIATFTGRIRNNSNRTLNRLSLRIRLYEYHFTPPETTPGQSWTREEFREFITPPWGSTSVYIGILDEETMEFLGEQIDIEDIRWFGSGVPASETRSFETVSSNTHLTTSNYWIWDYEIIRASSY